MKNKCFLDGNFSTQRLYIIAVLNIIYLEARDFDNDNTSVD